MSLKVNRWSHPELQDGEVFITNASDSSSGKYPGDTRSDWDACGWKTKRRGKVAYDIHGKPISAGVFPIFARREELEAAGVKIK